MKKILTFVCFILFLASLTAQESDVPIKKNKIGLSVSVLGESDILLFQQLEGAGSANSRCLVTVAFNYLHPLNKTLDLETGLEFSSFATAINPMIIPGVYPGGSFPTNYGNLNLLNIPVTLRANFWRFFYVNGGLLIDLDVSKSSHVDAQNGVGVMLGLGLKYEFKSGYEITINPYSKLHSMISFSNSTYPQRLLESGFRLGVMIPLK
ncbi:MAG: hypothetical protein PHT07_17245 [Paludibacter sp.]|nr:hypothetical protein [Paludibacter sp.]